MKKNKMQCAYSECGDGFLPYSDDEFVDVKKTKLNKKRNWNNKESECNICGESFFRTSKYERYCHECRQDSEVLRTHHWN